MLVIMYVLVLLVACATARGSWSPPAWWMRQAMCIHRHESLDWHRAGVDWAGRPSPYYGGMQFTLSTWRSVGGHGLPSAATPGEQLLRAWLVYRRDRSSWREWGTASLCGLR